MSDIEIPLADTPPLANTPEADIENATVKLVIERGEARNRVREIKGPLFLIGANEDADLVLGDAQFAEYHAYICLRGNEVTLRHLGNAPEVTINGRIVRWGELCDGDRLRMGPYQFRISIIPVAEPHVPQDTPATETDADPKRIVDQAQPNANPARTKRWAAHRGTIEAAPKSDAWKKATTSAQVVGWFDEVAEGQ